MPQCAIARVTASENSDGSQVIVVEESTAHKDTTRKSKVRGPYNNSQESVGVFMVT
ncbi:14988_t:CDS:2 [Gigaspora rosea]|nr:14988_t:CDS:2 [Gigaspora rosea]